MNYKMLVDRYKLKLKDMQYTHAKVLYDLIQPKYDGFWSLLYLDGFECHVIAAGGEERKTFVHPGQPAYLIAEWIFGTNWSTKFGADWNVEFVVHDIVMLNNVDIHQLPYRDRMVIAEEYLGRADIPKTILVPTFPLNEKHWRELWQADYEGVVFKDSYSVYGSPVGRCKHTFTMDYVFMGCNAGGGKYEGMAGSLKGGLYINGELREVCAVGGLTDTQRRVFWEYRDEWIGSVFEASGKQIFDSGALRHPAFLRFRHDKAAEECRL